MFTRKCEENQLLSSDTELALKSNHSLMVEGGAEGGAALASPTFEYHV